MAWCGRCENLGNIVLCSGSIPEYQSTITLYFTNDSTGNAVQSTAIFCRTGCGKYKKMPYRVRKTQKWHIIYKSIVHIDTKCCNIRSIWFSEGYALNLPFPHTICQRNLWTPLMYHNVEFILVVVINPKNLLNKTCKIKHCFIWIIWSFLLITFM